MDKGYVYILTNPSFREDWIKIGKSKKFPEIRAKELYNTAVPLPYSVYATIKTSRYENVEKHLHGLIKKLNAELRINPSREFFKILPQDAADILESLAEIIDDGEVEYWNEGKKVIAGEDDSPRKQGRKFSFYAKGLKDGDQINFVGDETITAAVVEDRKVIFEGKLWYLSPLAYEIFKRKDKLNSSGAYQGAAYFEHSGRKLKDLSDI